MDDRRFDRLARTLATGVSRRQAARALAGGLAALGGVTLGRAPTGAATDRSCKGEPAIDNERCPVDMGGGRGQCTRNDNCFCAITVAGDKRCVNLRGEECPIEDECDSGDDCDPGEVCIKVGGCCEGSPRNLCVRRCR